MTGRPSQEVLELEPLLDATPDFLHDDMTATRDSVDDKLDVEKIETSSAAGSYAGGVSPEERKLVRKLDSRIMPIACILYLFACESCSSARVNGAC